jgi:hypothetical protein
MERGRKLVRQGMSEAAYDRLLRACHLCEGFCFNLGEPFHLHGALFYYGKHGTDFLTVEHG